VKVLSTYPFFAQDPERIKQLRKYIVKHAGAQSFHLRQRQVGLGIGEGDPPVDRYRATVDDGTPERMGIAQRKRKKKSRKKSSRKGLGLPEEGEDDETRGNLPVVRRF
jgi:hypothetical protein